MPWEASSQGPWHSSCSYADQALPGRKPRGHARFAPRAISTAVNPVWLRLHYMAFHGRGRAEYSPDLRGSLKPWRCSPWRGWDSLECRGHRMTDAGHCNLQRHRCFTTLQEESLRARGRLVSGDRQCAGEGLLKGCLSRLQRARCRSPSIESCTYTSTPEDGSAMRQAARMEDLTRFCVGALR